MLKLFRAEHFTAIFTGLLAVVTGAALWYAHGQIREAHDESQIQHLMALVTQFDQEPMATYRKTLAEKRLKNESDPFEQYRVVDFFETVGLLVDRGYLNETDVWNQFGYWIFRLDADDTIHSNIDYVTKHDPDEYPEFFSLVRRMKNIEVDRRGRSLNLSKQDLIDFYIEESQILTPKGN